MLPPQLANNLKKYSFLSPLLVSSKEGETDAEFDERWEKIDALPEEVKDKISSKRIVEINEWIRDSFRLGDKIAFVSRAIRSYYFREIGAENMANYFIQNMQVDPSVAQKIASTVEKDILNAKFLPANKKIANFISVSLSEAVKKYEKLGEQLITTSPIKLKIFPAPVRPSIKNWISDYHEKAEAKKHDSIERGNYLFHTENAKKLTSGERQKLGTILKSLDEGSPLRIDPERQSVIFETEGESGEPVARPSQPMPSRQASQVTNRMAASNVSPRMDAPRSPVQATDQGMQFSSPQKFSSEPRSRFNPNQSRPYSPPALNSRPGSGPDPRVSGNIVDLRG